jgi:hypothetical protein
VCNEPNAFSLTQGLTADLTAALARQDSGCTSTDYLSIPNSGQLCSQTAGVADLTSKYCVLLNNVATAKQNVPICCEL